MSLTNCSFLLVHLLQGPFSRTCSKTEKKKTSIREKTTVDKFRTESESREQVKGVLDDYFAQLSGLREWGWLIRHVGKYDYIQKGLVSHAGVNHSQRGIESPATPQQQPQPQPQPQPPKSPPAPPRVSDDSRRNIIYLRHVYHLWNYSQGECKSYPSRSAEGDWDRGPELSRVGTPTHEECLFEMETKTEQSKITLHNKTKDLTKFSLL